MYRPLDVETVLEYVRTQPEARGHLDIESELVASEIGDGNLNLVFKIHDTTSERSLLIKQALPYVRAAGEDWPLSTERAAFEARALQLQDRYAPGSVPKLFWFDDALMLNAMETLADHEVTRFPLMRGKRFDDLGVTIGDFLTRTLYGTSDFSLDSAEKRRLNAKFVNTELCQITEDLVFTEPYLLETPRNRWNPRIDDEVRSFQSDNELKAKAASLKYCFTTANQALLHGDLHTGSIMSNDHDIRVIDPEFAFFGPMGFDIGVFIANLFLNAVSHEAHTQDPAARAEFQKYLIKQAIDTWNTFERGMRDRLADANSPSWRSQMFQDDFMSSVLQDTTGFAGAEMLRRIVGFAHVPDLDSIEDLDERARAERLGIQIGRALIHAHDSVDTLDDMISIVSRVLEASHD